MGFWPATADEKNLDSRFRGNDHKGNDVTSLHVTPA